jgi:hypothetical protein
VTRSFPGAGELAGCSHHTVEEAVARREAGLLGRPTDAPGSDPRRLPRQDRGVGGDQLRPIRADVAHDKLVAVGYEGSERTSQRAVAAVKAAYRAPNRRVYRPWVPEPGMWFQWDFGDGPTIEGRATRCSVPGRIIWPRAGYGRGRDRPSAITGERPCPPGFGHITFRAKRAS